MNKTIFEAYNDCKKKLEAAGIEDFGLEARMIIRHITGYSNAQIITKYAERLSLFQQNQLIALIRQREARYPLQYIFGEWGFYGREFAVGPGVLIPRSDTETAVEAGLAYLNGRPAPEVLDLCAGSGCIGITLAAECPGSRVTLLEKYEPALLYIKKNIERIGVPNADAVSGDIFSGDCADRKYDLIVSNPPYIPAEEMETVSPEVRYEPETALYGGEDGLTFYRAITDRYLGSLKPGGMLCFEVGINQSEAVAELLREAGLTGVETKSDLNGVERVVFGTAKEI